MKAPVGLKLFATLFFAICAIAVARSDSALANEIRIGKTLPYSGPVSAFGAMGRVQEAYFEKINAEGCFSGCDVKCMRLDEA